MKQLSVLTIQILLVFFLGLVTVSGVVIVVSIPALLYLLGAYIFQTPAPELEVSRVVNPQRVLPGEQVEITITVTNRGETVDEVRLWDTVPPDLEISDGSPMVNCVLREGESVTIAYSVTPNRGSYRFDAVTAELGGRFPLRSRLLTLHAKRELITLPEHRALARIPIAPRRTLVFAGTNPARIGGEGTEFFDVRESTGTENMRHVNWRKSARFEKVYVNIFQQERVADVAIMLDCRQKSYPDGSGLFEAATTAAASMVDATIEAGNRVGYLGFGVMVDWMTPGFGRIQRQRILTRIAESVPGESAVFTTLSSIPERLFPQGSQIVVVSPLTREDAVALERMIAYGYAVLVVSPDPTTFRLEPENEADALASNELIRLERHVLVRRLQHSGIAVINWDTTEALEHVVRRSLPGVRALWRRRVR